LYGRNQKNKNANRQPEKKREVVDIELVGEPVSVFIDFRAAATKPIEKFGMQCPKRKV